MTSDTLQRRMGTASSAVRQCMECKESKPLSEIAAVSNNNTGFVLYNSETWTFKEICRQKLLVFEMAVLRRVYGISPKDENTIANSERICCVSTGIWYNFISAASLAILWACVLHGLGKIY